ncbi:hypothetical protein [Naasia sp. SYSU D00057]|uniref:hypothetical protein n=1 Tax=Naasia sp. SYSU D00057 TaxID=2817380 RepID=UPI001B303A38|nr:hypothetical protein [Naasia sp. SYSU D00057]
MRTTIAFRVAAALALVTGLTAAGATAAFANETDSEVCMSLPMAEACIPDLPVEEDPEPEPDQSTPPPDDSGSTGGDAGAGSGGANTGGNQTAPGNAGTQPAPAPAAPAPAVPAPAGPAPAPAAPAPAPAAGSSGSAPAPSSGSASNSGSAAKSGSAVSDVPDTTTAAPAVPVAPQGPVLTQVESQAATRALEEARETLPTTVEPNTRLLAGNTSSKGSLMPSPDDSGLLALIVAMGVASAGCAVAAVVLRKRARPRHLAKAGRS